MRTTILGLARSPMFWPLAAAVIAFLVTVGLIWYANHPGQPTLNMDIELTEKACCTLLVWTNGLGTNDVASAPLRPGTRATYSFPARTQFLHYIRAGFAGHSEDRDKIRVHRIWTSRGDRVVDELPAEEVRGLGVTNADRLPEADGVTLRTTADFPYFETQAGLITDAGPRRLFFIELGEKPLHAVAGLLLVGIVLTVLFAIASWRDVVIALGLLATLLAVRRLPGLELDFRDDVSEAVGYSPYQGAWKIRDRLLLALAALLAVVIPVLTAVGYRLFQRGRASREQPDTPAAAPTRLSRRVGVALVAAPVVVLGLLGVPDLKDRIGLGRTAAYPNEWDQNNFVFWRYLIRRTDLEPMKDYFWPYGFQWIFEVGLPWGPLAGYVVFLSFWAGLALGSYWTLARFFGGRSLILRFGGLMAMVVVVALAGLVPFSDRYIGPLAVLLLYAGIDPADKLLSVRRVVFGVALLEVALFEPAQAIYALVPVAFLALAGSAFEVPRRRPELLGWLSRAAPTVGLPVLAALVVYATTGTLRANVDYYAQLDALNSSYAFPAAIKEWIDDPRTLDAFILWAVPLTIALGMLGLLFQCGRGRLAQAIVVAAGLLGLMVMQKQILRPHVGPNIWLTCVFGLGLWAVLDTSFNSVRRWMGVAATGAVLFAVVLMSGDLRPGLRDVARGVPRAVSTANAAFTRRDDFTADARAEFDLKRFSNFAGYEAVVGELRNDPALGEGGQIWVLGDDSLLAALVDRAWPYYFFELYDLSPISFQQALIDRLEEVPPERVVWNFHATEFDTVPHTVRVPLLFDWTVRHFAPLKVEGSFAIMRPLNPGEPAHLDWWRGRLGASIDLGHVPEASELRGRKCESGKRCETWLDIQLDSMPPPPDVVVPISVAGRAFEVKLRTSAESRRYVVRLDRLWFWNAAPPGSRRLIDTAAVKNASVSVVRRTVDARSLY